MNIVPHQTLTQPMARAAARPRPSDPAGCDNRLGVDGVDHLREQRHRADPAGVTAGLVALGDDDVGVAIGDAQGGS